MRMETPYASGFFVNHGGRQHPHNQADAILLWEALERATGREVELKSGDWVLDDPNELTADFVADVWSLSADFPALGDFVRVEANDGIVRFYGSATPAAHQALSKLWEILQTAGWERFDLYSDARRTRDRVSAKNPVGVLRRSRSGTGRHRNGEQSTRREIRRQARAVATREGLAVFRNLMAFCFAASVFAGPLLVQSAVAVATTSAFGAAFAVYLIEKDVAEARASH